MTPHHARTLTSAPRRSQCRPRDGTRMGSRLRCRFHRGGSGRRVRHDHRGQFRDPDRQRPVARRTERQGRGRPHDTGRRPCPIIHRRDSVWTARERLDSDTAWLSRWCSRRVRQGRNGPRTNGSGEILELAQHVTNADIAEPLFLSERGPAPYLVSARQTRRYRLLRGRPRSCAPSHGPDQGAGN
jgi:hypothetical protein